MNTTRGRWIGGALLAAFGLALGCGARPAPEPPPAVPEAAQAGYFEDRTAGSGVRFTYRNGEEAGHATIFESLGGGVGLIDFDGDGLLDVFLTGGGYFDGPGRKQIKGHPCRLYKNLGGWKFRDVTAEVGLDQLAGGAPWFYTHGAAVADYDNDGWPDLLVTGWHHLALFHNEPVDPKDASKLICAETFFRRAHEMDRLQPNVQRHMARLEDGSDLYSEGLPASVAFVDTYPGALTFQRTRAIHNAALWTNPSVCPQHRFYVGVSGGFSAEPWLVKNGSWHLLSPWWRIYNS